MSDDTLTRMDLADALFREIGLSRYESSLLVENIFDHLSTALIEGETVKISSFGTFISRRKRERLGRNPKTGKSAIIEARRVVTFKPSQLLRERVNQGNQD